MENPYSNREIDHHFLEIKETLNRIEVQTIKTNGRVTKCEVELSTVQTSGKIANWAFGLTVPIIVAMSVWVFFNQIESIKYELFQHEDRDKAKWDNIYKQFNLK